MFLNKLLLKMVLVVATNNWQGNKQVIVSGVENTPTISPICLFAREQITATLLSEYLVSLQVSRFQRTNKLSLLKMKFKSFTSPYE